MFRITPVGGLATWELSNPALSLALRILHQFIKHRMDDVTEKFSDFAESCSPPEGLRLSHVLKVLGMEYNRLTYFLI
jgi:hypothetical protein